MCACVCACACVCVCVCHVCPVTRASCADSVASKRDFDFILTTVDPVSFFAVCVFQGEGKSVIVPIKVLDVRHTVSQDGYWYVTLAGSRIAVRVDQEGATPDR